MKQEYKFIIDCLKNFINDEKTIVPKDIDFGTIVKYSSYHKIDGIIYQVLQDDLSNTQNDNIKILKRLYDKNIFFYANFKAVCKKVEEIFNENNIDFIFVKGLEIAKFYSKPFLRSMGDLDILVKKEDKEKAHELLLNCGFLNKVKNQGEWIYDCKGLKLELHHSLMYEEASKTNEIKTFLDDVWNYAKKDDNSCKYNLDINYFFVFLIIHTYKHFINSGISLRQFLDLAVIDKNCTLDWDFIKESLIKINLFDFAKTCFSLTEKWFDVSFPYKNEISQEFFEESSIFILENYFPEIYDNNNYEMYQLSKSKNTANGKLKKIFRFIFPSYNMVKEVEQYSFVNKKPFLMPVVWVYRFFRMIFLRNTKKSLKAIKKTANISKKDIENRTEFLNKWGIK